MAQSQSIRTDLPFLSFSSVFTRIRNRIQRYRSTTRPYHPRLRRIQPCSLKERGRGNEEDKVHLHLLVVAPERPAFDKLLAKEVLVPDIKAAEDLNLRPITTPAAVVADSPLHVPHQPSDLTLTKLIVFPILRREPKASKPVRENQWRR
jgi:hypothetical protein